MLGARANQPNSDSAPSQSVAPPPSNAAPHPSTPAIKLSGQITDRSGVLTPIEHAAVERGITKLYNGRGTRLWVVYVKNFGGLKPFRWAEDTMLANGFTDSDAILAVGTDEPAFSFRVPNAVIKGKAIDLETIRRDRIGPAVFHREWARAAIAAANGLDVAPS
jgi:serine/threonine-protein kinase